LKGETPVALGAHITQRDDSAGTVGIDESPQDIELVVLSVQLISNFYKRCAYQHSAFFTLPRQDPNSWLGLWLGKSEQYSQIAHGDGRENSS
jgi:hypothetical protein